MSDEDKKRIKELEKENSKLKKRASLLEKAVDERDKTIEMLEAEKEEMACTTTPLSRYKIIQSAVSEAYESHLKRNKKDKLVGMQR